jgi:hypothetical protein
MSTKRTYQIVVVEPVIIQSITYQEISCTLAAMIQMVREIVIRTKSFLASCRTCLVDNILYIQDELGIQKDLTTVLEAYGMTIKPVSFHHSVLHKGQWYQATSNLLDLIHQISSAGKQSLSELKELLGHDDSLEEWIRQEGTSTTLKNPKHIRPIDDNPFVSKILENAWAKTSITISETRQIEKANYDSREIMSRVIQVHSDQQNFESANQSLQTKINDVSTQHKEHVIQGTIATLEARAKSMGYTVTKKIVNAQVQLVLNRGR